MEQSREAFEAYEDRGVAGEETLASASSLRGGALLSRVELLARAQLTLLQRALAERHLRHAALVPAREQYSAFDRFVVNQSSNRSQFADNVQASFDQI